MYRKVQKVYQCRYMDDPASDSQKAGSISDHKAYADTYQRIKVVIESFSVGRCDVTADIGMMRMGFGIVRFDRRA